MSPRTVCGWLFCYTDSGAEQVGIVQCLITACRLQDIDPYTCLVDVLQRVGEHPASRVGRRTHPAAVEAAVRQRIPALGAMGQPGLRGKDGGWCSTYPVSHPSVNAFTSCTASVHS
jgi:hypothetical protein